MEIKCWFCDDQDVALHSDKNIEINFQKYRYADRLKEAKNEGQAMNEKLIIGRCDDCFNAHKTYNRLSLYGIIPFVALAVSFYMMFIRADEIMIAVVLFIAAISFGVIAFIRSKYLSKKGIKALIEMEMKNEQIQRYLAEGWFRK